jgi:hypothetical protein
MPRRFRIISTRPFMATSDETPAFDAVKLKLEHQKTDAWWILGF